MLPIHGQLDVAWAGAGEVTPLPRGAAMAATTANWFPRILAPLFSEVPGME